MSFSYNWFFCSHEILELNINWNVFFFFVVFPINTYSLFSGDITQKGYEKKRNKLLQPFVQAAADKAAAEKAAVQEQAAAGNVTVSHHHHQQQPLPEVSTVKSAAVPSPKDASSSASTSSSAEQPSSSGATVIAVPGGAAFPSTAAAASTSAVPGGVSTPSDQLIANKPRSRRTHRRYYNEKRYHSEVIKYCFNDRSVLVIHPVHY